MTRDERNALARLRREAEKSGAVVTLYCDSYCNELRVTAPAGYWFGVEGVHEFVDSANAPWQPDYEDALSRLKKSPPVKHEDPECDWCHEEAA